MRFIQVVIVDTDISSKAVEEPLVIIKNTHGSSSICKKKSTGRMTYYTAKNPVQKWEPLTEHVFCFAVHAARLGGVPKMWEGGESERERVLQ